MLARSCAAHSVPTYCIDWSKAGNVFIYTQWRDLFRSVSTFKGILFKVNR